MTPTEKYLAALDVPDELATANGHDHWPAGVPRVATETEHPLDCQFLDDRNIATYLGSLQDLPPEKLNGAGPGGARPVDFADLDRNWTAEQHPLALCEFLAYKSGLAYRSNKIIRHDLLGLDSKGRRYKEGVSEYAFFDTSQPQSTVRYGDTQAFVFVHQRTGYIIFRGSTNFSDWYSNLQAGRTNITYAGLPTVPQTLVGSAHPARHTGFAIAWGSIAPDVETWVRDQVRYDRIDRIILSGHSLGGALAVLGAYHFANRRICPIHAVVTFGAPKVGGEEFKDAYESSRLGLKDRTLRIEAAEDMVSSVSQQSDDRHVGHAWRFKKRPLRPSWQMMFFSPLVDAETASKKKIERIEKKQKAKEQAPPVRNRSNSDAAKEPQSTWQQYFLKMLLMALWYMTRTVVRALAAHSVEHRYGLYVSTLAYHQIRAHHLACANLALWQAAGQENERILKEAAFSAANQDLGRHLGVVRGRHPRTFRHLASRPIRVATPDELANYNTKYVNYVA